MKSLLIALLLTSCFAIAGSSQTLLDSAIAEQKQKNYDQALAYALEFLKTPNLSEASQSHALFTMAYCYEKKRNPLNAVIHYLEAIQVDADDARNVKAHYNIGALYKNFHLYDEAIRHYSRSIELNKDEAIKGKILIARAICYKYKSQYDSSLLDILEAQKIALEDAEHRKRLLYNAYNQRGLIKREMGQYDESMRYFQYANDLDIGINTLVNIGYVYHLRKQYNKAIETYMTTLGTKQNVDQQFKTYQKLGELYMELGKDSKSNLFLTKAESLYPEILYPDVHDINVYRSLANTYKESGEMQLYSKFFEQGYELLEDFTLLTQALLLEANKQQLISTEENFYQKQEQQEEVSLLKKSALAIVVSVLAILLITLAILKRTKKKNKQKMDKIKAICEEKFDYSVSPDNL